MKYSGAALLLFEPFISSTLKNIIFSKPERTVLCECLSTSWTARRVRSAEFCKKNSPDGRSMELEHFDRIGKLPKISRRGWNKSRRYPISAGGIWFFGKLPKWFRHPDTSHRSDPGTKAKTICNINIRLNILSTDASAVYARLFLVSERETYNSLNV